MKRTTIVLEDGMHARVQYEAERRRTSVSEIVRESLNARYGAGSPRSLSFVGIADSGDSTLASRLDEVLAAEWAEELGNDLSS